MAPTSTTPLEYTSCSTKPMAGLPQANRARTEDSVAATNGGVTQTTTSGRFHRVVSNCSPKVSSMAARPNPPGFRGT